MNDHYDKTMLSGNVHLLIMSSLTFVTPALRSAERISSVDVAMVLERLLNQ